ncbi:unnamed protein product [Rotaria socialis]|uniref:Uncharacterized protein n=1 Tax=Rotaria socialis TaxID=392032 RepID=A0A818YBE1_9BILA|nr:unnamed protein product [Rotaria socialis]CAF4304360.1 unnamed protein product [Rotaria socialis]
MYQHESAESSDDSQDECKSTRISPVSEPISPPMCAAAATSAPSELHSPSTRVMQNFIIVRLDANANENSKSFRKFLTQLRKSYTTLKEFSNVDECIEYIKSVKDEKIFLITSGSLGEKMVPTIHDLAQLRSIFIYCKNTAHHKEWAQQWPKITGVHSAIDSISKHLPKFIRESDQDAISMSFIPKSIMSAASSKQQNLIKLETTYQYSALLKQIVLETDENDTKCMEDFVAYCCQCQESASKFTTEEFKHIYKEKSSIWWYTSATFISSILNRAQQMSDMKAMLKMTFFIQNLHHQLKLLHEQQASDFSQQFIVYRSQRFSQEDFQRLSNAKGGLMSFNNFLSTTKEKPVAKKFAKRVLHTNNKIVSVIFIMTIDPNKISPSTTPFALIGNDSAFRQDNEILFTIHTVFHVDKIQEIGHQNRLYEVYLTIADDSDPQLAAINSHLIEKIDGNGWYRMGELMLQVGNFSQAKELYNELLKNVSNDNEKGLIYKTLGKAKLKQQEYQQAASLWEESLQFYMKALPQDHPDLAALHHDIGQVYNMLGDNVKALEYYNNEIRIREEAQSSNHPDLALVYSNISLLYSKTREYSKALQYAEKAYQINEEAHLKHDPDLATPYFNIGIAHDRINEYEKALEFYRRALKIRKTALPPNHLDLALVYTKISVVYKNMGDHSKALDYAERAHKINEKELAQHGSNLADSCSNLGLAYDNMKNYSKALEFYEKALKIKQTTLPSNHPDVANSYSHISLVYSIMGDYEAAIVYAEKACKIKEKVLSSNHPDLATAYYSTALAYDNMKQYPKALEFYKKALKIRETALPPNHPDLALAYNIMSLACIKMNQKEKALRYAKDAHKIREQSLPLNHLDLANSYYNIGYLHEKMKKYSKALRFYERAAAEAELSQPFNPAHVKLYQEHYKNMKKKIKPHSD